MTEGAFLFFTPEAGVVPHISIQILLARILKEKGAKVLFVRCHGMLTHCPVMDMYNLPHRETEQNKAKVCGSCLQASSTLLGGYGMESVDMKDFITVDMIDRIRSAMENLPRDLRDFRFDGIPFGTLTTIDLVLATKVSDFAGLSEEMREVWIKYLATALTAYLVTREIIRSRPIKAIVHHEDYGTLLAARVAGQQEGVPAIHTGFSGHMGGDRRRVFLMHQAGSGEDQKIMIKWPEWRDLALQPSTVRDPMDDLLSRFGSGSARVYSPKKTFGERDLHAELSIPREKKLLVLFTSSLDERLAVDSVIEALDLRKIHTTQPFKDQIEWIKAVLEFVGSREDFHVVVRIHPREGANKRESRISQHLHMLKAAFDRPFPNSTFIWPEMNVSSYDLAEIADLVLVAWTTLGLEVGRLGVPVLASTYSLGPRPVDDFHEWGKTPDEYFAKVREMTVRPPRLDSILHNFRWYCIQYFGHAVDLGDILPTRDFHGLPRFFMPREGQTVHDVFVGGRDMLDLKRRDLAALQTPDSPARERRALRAQLRRALRFLLTGQDSQDDYRLVLAWTREDPAPLLARIACGGPARGTVAMVVRGREVHWCEEGKVISRFSPMTARLALLGCDLAWAAENLPEEAAPLGSMEDFLACLEGRTASSPDRLGSSLAEIMDLKGLGRHQEALEAARKADAEGLRSPELFNLLGHLECLSGNREAGMAAFQKVVRDWPGHGKAHNNLSVLYWEAGDVSGALRHLTAGLASEPYNREIVANAIRITVSLGKQEEAERIRDYYLREKPQDGEFIRAAMGRPA